jgi:hypothetical protein
LFPFDSQECEVQLMSEDFDGHVTFQTLSDVVDLRFTETNSEWSIIATSADKFNTQPEIEQLNYKLTLKRHSKFIFLNLVVLKLCEFTGVLHSSCIWRTWFIGLHYFIDLRSFHDHGSDHAAC